MPCKSCRRVMGAVNETFLVSAGGPGTRFNLMECSLPLVSEPADDGALLVLIKAAGADIVIRIQPCTSRFITAKAPQSNFANFLIFYFR